ncbi:UTP--glucose-1-phosphate uridylyltransferase [Nitratidesulfovibrio sp. SRB-5]|uniref:UTP--glucose-1-phosphate uridylyltransferase n=1 Tax=Nitratidesulfovibrio sp. SRB-5 TaxID=2872636 RepID=UPI001CBA667B|nr:UTP--glucose-1-phosphate uridylyltransferase [Nitratidesulfovibrio sp. SRB-5]
MPHSGPELLTRPAAPSIAPARIPDADADTGMCTVPMQPFATKMARAGLPSPLVALFASYLEELACGSTGLIPESDILPVGRDDLPLLEDLAPYAATGRARLREAACIKLNGGLGTSMGMTHAKSLLPAKDGATFLELIVRQAEHQRRTHGGPSPLLFMNSFSTHQDTLRALDVLGLQHAGRPGTFLQHRFPKVSRATLLPVEYPENPDLEWNPPGHGDLYAALALSGHLARLLESGRRYALISNADNLGATLDPAILGYLMEEDIPFLMECAPRTPSDRKGGHLARSRHGGLVLRELAQCPDGDLPRFQDIVRYGLFNTNNIWLDLRALRQHIDEHGLLRLPMIRNPKTVNPRDPDSEKVWQVETAMGAAISLFPGARAIVTRRERFLPVKKCSDLLVLWSDRTLLEPGGQVRPNPACSTPGVLVELDGAHYGTWDRLMARFPHGAPSLLHCDALAVHGDVLFGGNVTARGRVVVRNPSCMQAVIPHGTVLEGDVHL